MRYMLGSLLLLSVWCYAQDKKNIQALQTKQNIAIDATLSESDWEKAPIATNFIMVTPDNGKPSEPNQRTEVQILYDNTGIYIAAKMYDDPTNVLQELTQRDDLGTADFFGVFINGFNDGQQDFRFIVSASGIQADCTANNEGEDYSWDAIWHSSVKVTDFGWIAELKIPYAAIRFSDKPQQTWGVNFIREIKKTRQRYSWNYINTALSSTTQQAGTLQGIENISPPTRLFLIPYVSNYYTHSSEGTENKFKAGMDIKYGINDAFTLDAILVPDFGQTAFDEVVLNLGPFEQQFNENRSFFSEGTDLFTKGNLLYTRRIGESSSKSANEYLNDNEIVREAPAINLLNATKVSGRTSKGLGIGVLNAVTQQTYAVLQDTVTSATRKVLTEPLANYNVTVFDQRFWGNSSATIINTNVTRNGSFRDANVTGLLFDLNTKKNTYNLWGNAVYNHINDTKNKNGYRTNFGLSKTSGKYRFNISTAYYSDGYDINDLGINYYYNYHQLNLGGNYRILKPTQRFNTFQLYSYTYIAADNSTRKYQNFESNLGVNLSTIKNDFFGGEIGIQPIKTYDFYEPRTEGRYSYKPEYIYFWGYVSTNYNRKFALDIDTSIVGSKEANRNIYELSVSPRYRINNHIMLITKTSWRLETNDKGFSTQTETDGIIFANRDRTTISNSISGKYTLNNKMNINLTVRHYLSYTVNNNFLKLKDDGFYEDADFLSDKDSNLSAWNLDLSYSWWFAPGSQLSFLYRNNAGVMQNTGFSKQYFNNLSNTLSIDKLSNTLSISIRYYMDYNNIKKGKL